MDYGKRWVADQAIHLAICTMMHSFSALMRVSTVHSEGLSKGELKYLKQRIGLIDRGMKDLTKLSLRVRTDTGPFRRHGA
jgi:hypothetical protein